MNKCTTLQELTAHVKTFGPRKEFNPGDVVVCVAKPYGQKWPVAGERRVVVEKVKLQLEPGGRPVAAGSVGDYLMSEIFEKSPEGFVVSSEHSGFFVLEADYTQLTTNTEN